jgi:hypothetical protein
MLHLETETWALLLALAVVALATTHRVRPTGLKSLHMVCTSRLSLGWARRAPQPLVGCQSSYFSLHLAAAAAVLVQVVRAPQPVSPPTPNPTRPVSPVTMEQ